MGKRIEAQRKGSSPKARAPSHRFKSKTGYKTGEGEGKVIDLFKDPSKTSVVMKVEWENGKKTYQIAPEGIQVGDTITQSKESEIEPGNITTLDNIPEGIPIFNIETTPSTGGKMIRSSGTFGYITKKTGKKIEVKLPSKNTKEFNPNCRATIGITAGGGRTKRPLLKAGHSFRRAKARGRLFPKVRGVAMNPVSHPHGGSQHHAGQPTTIKRNTPPGRKVGHVAAKRTGKKKGK